MWLNKFNICGLLSHINFFLKATNLHLGNGNLYNWQKYIVCVLASACKLNGCINTI